MPTSSSGQLQKTGILLQRARHGDPSHESQPPWVTHESGDDRCSWGGTRDDQRGLFTERECLDPDTTTESRVNHDMQAAKLSGAVEREEEEEMH